MVNEKWWSLYQEKKDLLRCKIDLDSYFSQESILGVPLALIEVGKVNFPTGQVMACDPLVSLEDALPFLQSIPVGAYPVLISVMLSKEYGDRYVAVKLAVSNNQPVRYELAVCGDENLEELTDEDESFGFGVDAGMGCICDYQLQQDFKRYWKGRLAQDEDIDPYNDLFDDLLDQNSKEHPQYQRPGGDWLNWAVPESKCNLALFASGWGDGVYPTYFGYDAQGQVCGVYILFIDIEQELKDE